MAGLADLLAEYHAVVEQERQLSERKEQLRTAITAEMARLAVKHFASPHGTAYQTLRFKLLPKREPVLALLQAEDLYPFANFTPNRVKQILVPKYGRERLLPLFDIEQLTMLVVKQPETSQAATSGGASQRG